MAKNNSSSKPIHINPSEKGSFREATGTKAGDKVNRGDESKILNANPGEKVTLSTGKTVVASPELRKKANFAKNFGK